MDWRPIDTAPKDGTEVLLFHLGRVIVGSWSPVWHPDNKKWVVRHPQVHPDETNRSVTDIGPDYDMDGSLNKWSRPGPTHWMPLPAPPGAELGIPIYSTQLDPNPTKGLAVREVPDGLSGKK